MKTLTYQIEINASSQTVFDFMISKEGFKIWSSQFDPSSNYKGEWKEGSQIQFLVNQEENGLCGMISKIIKLIPNKIVQLQHIGALKNNNEIYSGEEVDTYKGTIEEYVFEVTNSGTLLSINCDAIPEWEDYFNNTWPKALKVLKASCEY